MTAIRYVCISDLHLGEEDSLLTNLRVASTDVDPAGASPVLTALVRCLEALVAADAGAKKPTLILAGDILELALTNDNQAMMVFERFIELIMPPGARLFDEIIYIPGNHDHHLWELARETQYVNYVKTLEPGSYLPNPWHVTNMLPARGAGSLPSFTLTGLVQRYPHLRDFVVKTAYPNYALFDDASRRCVAFSHGHYIESLYHLMTTLTDLLFPDRARPVHVWDFEAENFAWIDFFWSALGRSGDVGQDVERIYEKLGDKAQVKRLLAPLADGLAKKYDLPGPGERIEAWLLKLAIGAVVDRFYATERKAAGGPLSQETLAGLDAYMTGPLKEQILTDLKGNMPAELTFVFGHTHKPFEKDLTFRGYPEWASVYNTGGWVVETPEPEPEHGGSVVLVDEALNVVSLRLYNESGDAAGYAVRLEQARHPGAPENDLFKSLAGRIDPAASPWRDLSDCVAREVPIRAANLKARIDGKTG